MKKIVTVNLRARMSSSESLEELTMTVMRMEQAVAAERWVELKSLLNSELFPFCTRKTKQLWAEAGIMGCMQRALSTPSLFETAPLVHTLTLRAIRLLCGDTEPEDYHDENRMRASQCLGPVLDTLLTCEYSPRTYATIDKMVQLVWILCNAACNGSAEMHSIFLEHYGPAVLRRLFQCNDENVLFSACGACCHVAECPEICDDLLPIVDNLVQFVKKGGYSALTACLTLANISKNSSEKFTAYVPVLTCVEEWVMSRDYKTFYSGMQWVTTKPILCLLNSPYPPIRLLGVFISAVTLREKKDGIHVKFCIEGSGKRLGELVDDPATRIAELSLVARDMLCGWTEKEFTWMRERRLVGTVLACGGKFGLDVLNRLLPPAWRCARNLWIGAADECSVLNTAFVPDLMRYTSLLLFLLSADDAAESSSDEETEI